MGKLLIEATLSFIVFCGIFQVMWHLCKRWFFKDLPSHIFTAKKIFKAAEDYDKEIDKL